MRASAASCGATDILLSNRVRFRLSLLNAGRDAGRGPFTLRAAASLDKPAAAPSNRPSSVYLERIQNPRDALLYIPSSEPEPSSYSSSPRAHAADRWSRRAAGGGRRLAMEGSYVAEIRMLEAIYSRARREAAAAAAAMPAAAPQPAETALQGPDSNSAPGHGIIPVPKEAVSASLIVQPTVSSKAPQGEREAHRQRRPAPGPARAASGTARTAGSPAPSAGNVPSQQSNPRSKGASVAAPPGVERQMSLRPRAMLSFKHLALGDGGMTGRVADGSGSPAVPSPSRSPSPARPLPDTEPEDGAVGSKRLGIVGVQELLQAVLGNGRLPLLEVLKLVRRRLGWEMGRGGPSWGFGKTGAGERPRWERRTGVGNGRAGTTGQG